jgi:hypothetical protein
MLVQFCYIPLHNGKFVLLHYSVTSNQKGIARIVGISDPYINLFLVLKNALKWTQGNLKIIFKNSHIDLTHI